MLSHLLFWLLLTGSGKANAPEDEQECYFATEE